MTIDQLLPILLFVLANGVLHVARFAILKYLRNQTELRLGVKIGLDVKKNEIQGNEPNLIEGLVYGLREWKVLGGVSPEIKKKVSRSYRTAFLSINILMGIVVAVGAFYAFQETLSRI